MTRDYPLSQPQRRLWFLNRGADGDEAYNVPVCLRLSGPLDVPALREAVRCLTSRHEVLRTRFYTVDEEPRQRILAEDDPAVPQVVLEEVVDGVSRATELSRVPFDLAEEVPLRLHLLNEGPSEHVLLLLTHHVACDGQSLDVLLRELAEAYRAQVAGAPPAFPELPVRYVDYVLWKQDLLGELDRPTPETRRLLDFWREALADAPRELDIPHDTPDPHGPCEVRLPLDAEVVGGLERLARASGSTPGMICQAAVAAVLARVGAGPDLPLGTVTSGREDAALDDVVGFFNNPLVVRIGVRGVSTLTELLGEVKQATLAALAHQAVPFDWVVRDLNPPRTGRPPLYQVSVEFHHAAEDAELDLGSVRGAVLDLPLAGAKLELSWDFAMLPDGTGGTRGELQVSFDPARYDAATAERLSRWTTTMLRHLVSSPGTLVRDVPLTDAGTEIVHRPSHPGLERCVVQRVRERTQAAPGAVAVRLDARDVTYAELVGRASATARLLQEDGVRPGEVVPVLAERGDAVIVAFLALRTIGAVYLPLDPTAPLQRRRDLCEQVGARRVLVDPAHGPRQVAASLALPTLTPAAVPDPEHRWVPEYDGPDRVAYVIFTSGSTGTPKGAMVHPRGMVNNMLCEAEALRIDAPVLSALTAPLTFDISVWQMLTPLLFGGTVRPVATEVTRDPVALFGLASTERWEMLQVVPSLLEAALDEWDAGTPLPDLVLSRLGVTGEALPPTVAARWLQRFPGIPLVNCYGPTECSDDVTHAEIAGPGVLAGARTPIGRSTRGSRLYVLDESLAPVPAGTPGELYVGGLVVGRGYLGDPARTASTFVADPFSEAPGARMYRTGDVVRKRSDGLLEFCGRQDHQVKIRGRRIELGEIEHALRGVPGVQTAAATVVRDEHSGAQLAGFWTGTADARTVRDHLALVLPHELVPTYLTLLDCLPLNGNGKVDRAHLPQVATVETSTPSEPPRTPSEKVVCDVFTEVLKRDTGRTGDFFAHGGHSLVALRVLRQVNAALGSRLTMRHLFERPTPAGLAALLADTDLLVGSEDRPLEDSRQAAPSVTTPGTLAGVPNPRRVLLTGATGFLGVHLLRELLDRTEAEVVCPVRAADLASGMLRLQESLANYRLDDGGLDRVRVVPADLSLPGLGLRDGDLETMAEGLDLVVHNAARVSFAHTYDQLRAENVESTRILLALAARAGAAFHLVSSTGAIGAHFGEDTVCDLGDVGTGGYEQSKWVAERLVENAGRAGLPVVVHRPGRMSGSTLSGIWAPHDAFWMFVRACVEASAVPSPGVVDFVDTLVPVDHVATALVALATSPATPSGAAYHHVGRTEVSFDEMAAQLRERYGLDALPGQAWRAALAGLPGDDAAARGVEALLAMAEGGVLADHVVHDRSACDAALATVGVEVPAVTAGMIQRYLDQVAQSPA
jgi:amino acid adenylation domain-containing protein/thioester reductase-like protein